MFPARSIEEFKKSIETNRQPTRYRNYFATLEVFNRPAPTVRVKGKKRLTPEERLAILKELL